jgi:hypothetical protein
MRPFFIVPVALVLAATSASAQTPVSTIPTAYICTPDSQVLKVTNAGVVSLLRFQPGGTGPITAVLPDADTSGITDCGVGTDGRVYAAKGRAIVRFTPNPVATDVKRVAYLASNATGFAFNLGTLYVSTALGTTVALPNVTTSDFVTAQPSVPAGSGGVAFDVDGSLIVASPGAVSAFAPPYLNSATAETTFPIATPGGVTVETCGDVLATDTTSRKVLRVSNGGTAIEFPRKDIPAHLEAAYNRVFVTTNEEDGANGKLFRADFAFKTGAGNCGTASPTKIVDLKDLTTGGPNNLPGLLSSRVSGVAVEPNDVSLTQTFNPSGKGPKPPVINGPCSQTFHFGYHLVEVEFLECKTIPPDSDLTIVAVESLYDQVTFTSAVGDSVKVMRYSPMSGNGIQFLMLPGAELVAMDDANTTPPFIIRYGFFTQELVAEPGVARRLEDDPLLAFNEIVGNNYWDVDSLDPLGGEGPAERERDWSKRVVFNKAIAVNRICTPPDAPAPPMFPQNALFNSPQTVPLKLEYTGTNCADGTLRVSIVRVFDATVDSATCEVVSTGPNARYETQLVIANTPRAPGDENLLESVNNTYSIAINASPFNTTGATPTNPAQFLASVWGDLAPPKNYCFRITK